MLAERGLLALSGVPIPDLNFCLVDDKVGFRVVEEFPIYVVA